MGLVTAKESAISGLIVVMMNIKVLMAIKIQIDL
jgi:hypothetical protein